MSWTAPTSRATGDLITASIWNTDIVNNLTYLHGIAVTTARGSGTAYSCDGSGDSAAISFGLTFGSTPTVVISTVTGNAASPENATTTQFQVKGNGFQSGTINWVAVGPP